MRRVFCFFLLSAFAFTFAFALEDAVLTEEIRPWMQPIKTLPWPEEEADFLNSLHGFEMRMASGDEKLCKAMTDDLIALKDVEYVPPVHASLLYDTPDMRKILGPCENRLILDMPSYLLFIRVAKFTEGFKIFMGNYDNISEKGNEIIIAADGAVVWPDEKVYYRHQRRIKHYGDTGLYVFVLSPADSCSKKYNNKELLGQSTVDVKFNLFAYALASDFIHRFYGVLRYKGREYVYTFWKLALNENFGIEIVDKNFNCVVWHYIE
jgi:hypothetical protein